MPHVESVSPYEGLLPTLPVLGGGERGDGQGRAGSDRAEWLGWKLERGARLEREKLLTSGRRGEKRRGLGWSGERQDKRLVTTDAGWPPALSRQSDGWTVDQIANDEPASAFVNQMRGRSPVCPASPV